MSESTKNFFVEKRPWSLIKDIVLKEYMPPYLAKVKILGQPILLIDGYAGPGIFEDGKAGSPMIICDAAEKVAKGNYQAIFINKNREHHKKLTTVLQSANLSGKAYPLLGDSTLLLQTLPRTLRSQTVFVYLDPFGPTGCPFDVLKPFLERNSKFSTEILLTMSMPGIHRLAGRRAVEEGRSAEEQIRGNHQKLTRIFGGDYWQRIIWSSDVPADVRERHLMDAYVRRLSHYLPCTGFCPVRERAQGRVKYYIIFASRHPHAMLLMNDSMINAYFSEMHKVSYKTGLFADIEWDWHETRRVQGLDQVILDTVRYHPGETREMIWLRIVRAHFFEYLGSEYRETVQKLVDERRLISPTPRSTKRLNDKCVLCLPD